MSPTRGSLPLAADGNRSWDDVTSTDPLQVPLAREAVALAHDPGRDRAFIIGGLNGDVSLNDVWVASAGDGVVSWEQLCSPTSCGPAPEPRWGAHAVWDGRRGRVVLFGGRRSDGSSLNDTWVLEVGPDPRWVPIDTGPVRPPARWAGAATYDPRHDRMVVFGGQAGRDSAATPFADTWSLALDGHPQPRWEELHPTGDAPSPRRGPAYATPSRNRGKSVDLLVASGLDATTGTHHNDVWRLSLSTFDGRWVRLAPDACASSAAPPPCVARRQRCGMRARSGSSSSSVAMPRSSTTMHGRSTRAPERGHRCPSPRRQEADAGRVTSLAGSRAAGVTVLDSVSQPPLPRPIAGLRS